MSKPSAVVGQNNKTTTGTNWICGPDKFEHLAELASPHPAVPNIRVEQALEARRRIDSSELVSGGPVELRSLQYSNLDEEQFRVKLSQMPNGTKLQFQIWKPGQISPPVGVEKQEGVFQSLQAYARNLE